MGGGGSSVTSFYMKENCACAAVNPQTKNALNLPYSLGTHLDLGILPL
jgi:hypothetical protein